MFHLQSWLQNATMNNFLFNKTLRQLNCIKIVNKYIISENSVGLPFNPLHAPPHRLPSLATSLCVRTERILTTMLTIYYFFGQTLWSLIDIMTQ